MRYETDWNASFHLFTFKDSHREVEEESDLDLDLDSDLDLDWMIRARLTGEASFDADSGKWW